MGEFDLENGKSNTQRELKGLIKVNTGDSLINANNEVVSGETTSLFTVSSFEFHLSDDLNNPMEILLSDSAKAHDYHGFLDTFDVHLPSEYGEVKEKVSIEKYDFVSWSGIRMKRPVIALLYYGKILYFYSKEEFGKFNREYFLKNQSNKCPVCGKSLGRSFKYLYLDITRSPQEFYVCSKECLSEFTRHSSLYLNLLSKYNSENYIDKDVPQLPYEVN